jgi:hypothetical protein
VEIEVIDEDLPVKKGDWPNLIEAGFILMIVNPVVEEFFW